MFFDNVTYYQCQSCTAKIHCDQCSEDVSKKLLRMDGVQSVNLNLKAKTIDIAMDAAKEKYAEDMLEDAGIFL